MKTRFAKRLIKFLSLRTIYSKTILTFAIFAMVILFFMTLSVTSTITKLEEDLIADRLVSDINYIEDLISGNNKTANWEIKDGSIYFGDVLIGDGTEETANFAPFLEHEEKTGTLAYVFLLDKDAQMGYVEQTDIAEGYREGHYKRVAGSTKGPDGKSIVGTYITKNVADALDSQGTFSGEAIVAGGLIYCLYKTLLDKNGNIIGAMVVGRSITELKSQISASVNNINVFMIFIVILCCVIVVYFLSRWISSIEIITDYLQELENGVIPEKQLTLVGNDEMSLVSESINQMVVALKENTILRKKSETDALTGLPNRFAYDVSAKSIYQSMSQNPRTLAVEILDIDYFKEYNDNYGHQAGDKCIQEIADEIHQLNSEHDNIFCCRYGGDEFVIIYCGYTAAEVEYFVQHLKERIQSRNIKHGHSKVSDIVTITQGVCFGMFRPGILINDYFYKADQALYDVKKISRNNYSIVDI